MGPTGPPSSGSHRKHAGRGAPGRKEGRERVSVNTEKTSGNRFEGGDTENGKGNENKSNSRLECRDQQGEKYLKMTGGKIS